MAATDQLDDTVRSAVPVGLATILALLLVGAGMVHAGLAVFGDLWVRVPVTLGSPAPAWSEVVLPCVEGWSLGGEGGCQPAAPTSAWPGGAALPVGHVGIGEFVADVPPSADAAALLGAAPVWAGLIAGGIAVLLLVPVVRSTARGRPFAAANSRRLAGAAAAAGVGWAIATLAPWLAAGPVVRHLESTPQTGVEGQPYAVPPGWLEPDLRIEWWPALVVGLLLAFAAATWRGERMAGELEGLV